MKLGKVPNVRSTASVIRPEDAELPGLLGWKVGAGRGNRTLVFSLEGCCSTIELYPRAASGNTSRDGPQPHVRSHPLPAATGGLRLDFKGMTCGHAMYGCRPTVDAGPPSLSFRGARSGAAA
jgi:hypothetical protein